MFGDDDGNDDSDDDDDDSTNIDCTGNAAIISTLPMTILNRFLRGDCLTRAS